MRYRLRTLLIVLAIGLFVAVVVWQIARDLGTIADYINVHSLRP